MAGRGTAATIVLERAKIPFTLHEYAHDPRHESYGLEASEALGVPPERVFKTLVAAVDGSALSFGTIFCSGGRRGLEIEIAPIDLIKATGAAVASIAARDALLPVVRRVRGGAGRLQRPADRTLLGHVGRHRLPGRGGGHLVRAPP